MSSPEGPAGGVNAFPGEWMHLAERELERIKLAQQFRFDQKSGPFADAIEAIVALAAEHRASGAADLDVYSQTLKSLKAELGAVPAEGLLTTIAGLAVALADERANRGTDAP